MKNTAQTVKLQDITPSFNFLPFGDSLRPFIDEALRELGKDTFRKGTVLVPVFVVYVVLALTLRRDLNTQAVIEWMVSATRWIDLNLTVKLLSEGALSHARVALSYEVFALIFYKVVATWKLEPDFHHLVSVVFDGTTLTMPDTQSNREEFGKPGSTGAGAAFPQLRLCALVVGATHLVLDLAYSACRGKGTGERSLMGQILERVKRTGLLFLFDAGFYSFALVYQMQTRSQHFIMKVSKSVKLMPIKGSQMADGSYEAIIRGKIEGQWQLLRVRVLSCQLRGFRPFRLITNLMDEKIAAREIVKHYHKRWEIEIAFDEIKTHQCATLRGQSPTVLRSKRQDLVKQELYALVISYNEVRCLMEQGAERQHKLAVEISFLDSLQSIIDAVPNFNWSGHPKLSEATKYLIMVIGKSEIDRARRPRVNPRVVKVKMSKFKRKRETHQGESRDFDKDLTIIAPSHYQDDISMDSSQPV